MRITHHIKQHLVPTRHNGFVPHLLREKQVIGMLIIGVLAFSAAQYVRYANTNGLTADVYPATIINLTNHDRVANNLPAVSTNALLQEAARLKAEDMAAKGYFAHTSPEGMTPWYWFSKVGYSFIFAGENLAINFNDSGSVETAWLDSPTHRANIMNKNFTEMGVATATGLYNGQQTTFVVEMFGMPSVMTKPAVKPPTAAVPPPATAKTTPAPEITKTVAGEATTPLTVLKETPTFSMVQNTDPAFEPADPVSAPAPKLPWYAQIIRHSDRLAGLILETILILAIITTAGMVAREYEKHHRKHMAYGALLSVIMFTALFVGGFGVFSTPSSGASVPVASAHLQ